MTASRSPMRWRAEEAPPRFSSALNRRERSGAGLNGKTAGCAFRAWRASCLMPATSGGSEFSAAEAEETGSKPEPWLVVHDEPFAIVAVAFACPGEAVSVKPAPGMLKTSTFGPRRLISDAANENLKRDGS